MVAEPGRARGCDCGARLTSLSILLLVLRRSFRWLCRAKPAAGGEGRVRKGDGLDAQLAVAMDAQGLTAPSLAAWQRGGGGVEGSDCRREQERRVNKERAHADAAAESGGREPGGGWDADPPARWQARQRWTGRRRASLAAQGSCVGRAWAGLNPPPPPPRASGSARAALWLRAHAAPRHATATVSVWPAVLRRWRGAASGWPCAGAPPAPVL